MTKQSQTNPKAELVAQKMYKTLNDENDQCFDNKYSTRII